MSMFKAIVAASLIGSAGLSPAPLEARAVAPVVASQPFASDRIEVRVEGQGRDVILIPGLASSPEVWRDAIRRVPGYRYHLIQVKGFSGTKAGANASGPVVGPVADEIARYIKQAGLKSPALVGHSMGGTLAMMVAAAAPERVGRVMVVDMLPEPAGLLGGNSLSVASFATGLRDMLTRTPAGRQILTNFLSNYGGGQARDADPDVVAQATHELALTDLTPQLARIRAPLTIVFAAPAAPAEASRVTANYRRAYATAKGARLVAVPNSGHMVMADQPARFQQALEEFLAP